MAEKVLVLRTSDSNRKSYYGFQWPESGPVEAPDWDPTPKCGHGLHGALWGEGDGSLLQWDNDATWQVLEVDADTVVDLGGKVKFPRGNVVYSGDRKGATDYILSHPNGKGRAVIGAEVSAGDDSMVTVGYKGTAIAGYHSMVTAGKIGTAIAGNDSTATAGYNGSATVGRWGRATVGGGGTARAGDHGKATAGNYGTAITGNGGTATAGLGGKAQAGEKGRIHIEWHDSKDCRYRLATGYIGENGLKPNTLYQVLGNGNFIKST